MTRRRGFTYIELMISMVVLGVLAAAILPTSRTMVKRRKEVELRRVLLETREAIDRYRRAVEDGVIDPGDTENMGYPEDFDTLVQGVPSKKHPGRQVRFLRRIPIDPMTGNAEWGKRSVQDDVDDTSWGGENLFDIFSLSRGTALDGTEYATW